MFVRAPAPRSVVSSEQGSGRFSRAFVMRRGVSEDRSSPTRAKSIPAGSLDLSRDLPATHWFFGAVGELEVADWDHAFLDSLHRQPKQLFGVGRESGGALKGSCGSLRFSGNGPGGSSEFYGSMLVSSRGFN